MENNFTPLSALSGGVLIGIAAAWLYLANGRIAGISGIVGGLLSPSADDVPWRAAFVAGLIAGPLLYRLAVDAAPVVAVTPSFAALIASGLLVGYGTRLGGGCTSGHGVCGIARLSPRSIAATAMFMAVAVLTVYLARHVAGD
jgi:hypothetical protein